jgi:hypothetical protein
MFHGVSFAVVAVVRGGMLGDALRDSLYCNSDTDWLHCAAVFCVLGLIALQNQSNKSIK